MLVASAKSNLACEAGCGVTVSFSDHSRILLGSCSDRSRIGNDVPAVFEKFLRKFQESFCVAGAVFGDVWRMTPVVPRIVINVSYVTRISHDSHFAWQAQYLVMLEDAICCSARCK